MSVETLRFLGVVAVCLLVVVYAGWLSWRLDRQARLFHKLMRNGISGALAPRGKK